MDRQKRMLAEKVLGYWFALEFLAQDKYPDSWEITGRVRKYKESVARGTGKQKVIEDFIFLTDKDAGKNLYKLIADEASACGMTKWGNLTIYIGRVKREKCIDCIAEVLPFSPEDGDRPEHSTDKIAWASLQISPEGDYIERSLSLSTIIWALNQIKTAKGDISRSLDDKLYKEAVEELEKKFFAGEKESAGGQICPADAVSLSLLHDLYKEIEKRYIKGNIKNNGNEKDAYEEVYGISFQLFADEAEKSKKEEDNYLGLAHDYFSEDIRLVFEQTGSGALEEDAYLGRELLDYVTVLHKPILPEGRIDLVAPKKQDRREYLKQLSEILSIENAPLGKWPSRFMPALMQQIAVNLSIQKGTSDLSGTKGRVFSVNGPPGTGKTTLLKEIVVSNIIERAILLSKYDNPDDAFCAHNFLHGAGPDGAYSQYTRRWYSLKEDAVNDYSILVASCNNAAVENISKELPKSMLGDLSPLDGDTEELKELLKEAGSLFDPEASETMETTYRGESYRDVYFTKYAQELLDSRNVWGLVAAPLGRKSNLSSFYNKALYPLGRDFYKNKAMAQERVKSYQRARKAFEQQLEIVKTMQKALKKAGDLAAGKEEAVRSAEKFCRECEGAMAACRGYIESAGKQLAELKEEGKEIRAEASFYEKELRQAKEELQAGEDELAAVQTRVKESLEKELQARKSAGIGAKLFRRAEYKAAVELAERYHKDAEEGKTRAALLEEHIRPLRERAGQAREACDGYNQEYREFLLKVEQWERTITGEENKIIGYEKQIMQARQKVESARKEYEAGIRAFTHSGVCDSCTALDEDFVEELLSGDIRKATGAQVANPWFTQRYNREREKLFGYAMRLNKEFVVSSNHCRDNFITLSHYWGLRPGDENERIVFHREDKENMVPALFQTLFLLVPVISSTFASIGNLLKDVRQTGAIGMLVVDEAGQAQPQMALGALYRSRRAVIVGDPKQVEPVVTDDLILLRKAYNDDTLKPYKKKTLSVQGFADRMNPFGTWLDNGTDYPDWAGCPLLVHRRCISPMYDISNEISYGGIMKQQTRGPKPEREAKFIFDKSQWIQVKGKEKGNKNHFVEEQGKKVCELLERAFSKNPEPSLYIISPFTSVVSGIRDYMKQYCRKNSGTTKINIDYMLDYEQKKIGTVHTFQGKEADEVIFLLGCDTGRKARGAVNWVNRNIVNVAATRAKFRLYVIGDEDAWKESSCVNTAKEIIDTFAIKEIRAILEQDLPEGEKQEALRKASQGLPPATAFSAIEIEDEKGGIDYSIETAGFIRGLDEAFLGMELSANQLGKFGFKDRKDLNSFSVRVRENLLMGMKLFFLLEPVYQINNRLDASCCAILFCKAAELQMKDCFADSLKGMFPGDQIVGFGKGRSRVPLKDARSEELTLGAFCRLLANNKEELARRMEQKGNAAYDKVWWEAFAKKLKDCTDRRNQCCHSGLFSWKEQSFLLFDMFKEDAHGQEKDRRIGGIMFESGIGKKLT